MAKPVNEKDKGNKPETEINTKTMMIITTIIMIIVVIICMLVMYILLDSSFSKKISKIAPVTQEQEEDEEDEEETTKNQEGVLLDLGDFIMNLADTNSKKYIKVEVALELSKTQQEIETQLNQEKQASSGGHGHSEEVKIDPNAAIMTEMERYKPVIRDAVISALSNKTSDELSTPIGKELAKDEITEAVNGIFNNRRKVQRVSFGQFIIQ